MTHPTGTVTFLFTDIEGSTKLAQGYPHIWETLRKSHDDILRPAIESHNGYVFQIIGDAFCAAFHTAGDALRAAVKSQVDLHNKNDGNALVKVRMGIHTGKAELLESGDYQGYMTLSRVQRLMSAGHGGQVLISLATQELVRDELPEGISLHDLGERRLKDLIRPEHIHQLVIPNLPVDFPPLKTLENYRHNLPTQLTSFIGREKEMAEIKQALAKHRLVTLTGSGGAGKTRLSLQVAADSLDQFPNGIWFVELAPLTDPDLIPQTILSAADMQTQSGKSALESLTDFLREKTSLLLLDNCEHLIEACAKIADTLLNAAPNLKILISSREALGIKGEQSWRVPSLSAPDVKYLHPLEQLSQYEAVRLFIDRALLVQPHFAITNENAPAVAQICYRLDGIPLAIELAAARLRILSAEQISARLDDRFRLLTGGSRTALPRQQTLRALIDWSYDLLSENERTLLRRLAVFSGGYTLEAVEQVCSDDHLQVHDILDLLTHLMDKSLLMIDGQSDHLRYRLLETVRQYAREKLAESDEGEQIRKRHLEYYLNLGEEAKTKFRSSEWLLIYEQLENEWDNFRAALAWTLMDNKTNESEKGLRLANAYYIIVGFNTSINKEVLDWLQKGLVLVTSPSDKTQLIRAEALLNAGNIILDSENSNSGHAMISESVALYRANPLTDPRDLASTLEGLGQSFWIRGDREKAEASTSEGLAICQSLGNSAQWNLAVSLYMAGWGAYWAKDYDLAWARGQESKTLFEKLGDRINAAKSLDLCGNIAVIQRDYATARSLYQEALIIAQQEALRFPKALHLYINWFKRDIARVDRLTGNYQSARETYEELISFSRDTGDKSEIGGYLLDLGITVLKMGDNQHSAKLLFESLSVWKEMDYPRQIQYNLVYLADIFRIQEQPMKAARLLGSLESKKNTWSHPILDDYEKCIVETRTALGEDAFNEAWAEGATMPTEEAIKHALEVSHE